MLLLLPILARQLAKTPTTRMTLDQLPILKIKLLLFQIFIDISCQDVQCEEQGGVPATSHTTAEPKNVTGREKNTWKPNYAHWKCIYIYIDISYSQESSIRFASSSGQKIMAIRRFVFLVSSTLPPSWSLLYHPPHLAMTLFLSLNTNWVTDQSSKHSATGRTFQ